MSSAPEDTTRTPSLTLRHLLERHNPIWEAALSRLLGLEGLSTGLHYYRNEQRERTGCVWVRTFWWALIVPSSFFRDPWALCIAHAEGKPFRQTCVPDWTKAAFTTDESSAVFDISDDPVSKSLRTLDLSTTKADPALDGISYLLNIHNDAVDASLVFSNPTDPGFKELERSLFSIGREAASRVPTLEETLNVWSGYLVG